MTSLRDFPLDSELGGGSLPEEWTVAANGALELAPSGPAAELSSALTVEAPPNLPTLTLAGQNEDGSVRFDAVEIDQPRVAVEMLSVTDASVPEIEVSVTGALISITVANVETTPDIQWNAISTAAEVAAAVNADPDASLLVVATALGDGSGFAQPYPAGDPIAPVNYLAGAETFALDLAPDQNAGLGSHVLVWRNTVGEIVGYLDNDGGGALSGERVSFSQLGNIEVNNGNPTPGTPVFLLRNLGTTLFSVTAPGGGYGINIGGYQAGDIPLLLYAAGGQTADLVQVFDENADTPVFAIAADGGVTVRLPTSNPGAGKLWNDGGAVKVGT